MNMKRLERLLKRAAGCALSGSIALGSSAYGQVTDIYSQPLAQPASNVKPNIMLLFDDSGSMRQQYTPDYLGRKFGGSNPLCFDAKDDGGNITGGLDNCDPGDPPLMSPDVNTQYYNPEIRYFPPLNADGTSKPSMTCTNTGGTATGTYPFCSNGWTVVPTDGVSSGTNVFKRDIKDLNIGTGSGTQVDNSNLAAQFPDRAWCQATGDGATTSNCRINSSYTYPDNTYGYGLTSGGNIKYRDGAPYYYRITADEHCTDQTFTNCIPSATPTSTHPLPAKVRFCTDSTFTNCQAKYTGSYTYPKFLGTTATAGASAIAGVKATATITVKDPQSDSLPGSITSILAGGTELISTTIVGGGGNTTTYARARARDIRDAINANTAGSGGYTAHCGGATTGSCSTNVVTVTYPTAGSEPNGVVLSLTSPTSPSQRASYSFTLSSIANGDNTDFITVGGVTLFPSTVTCSSGSGCSNSYANNGRNGWFAEAIAAAISANTVGGLAHGFTATASGATVTITAPVGTGAEMNDLDVTIDDDGFSVPNGVLSGGTTTGDIETTVVNFSNGVDPVAAGQTVRVNVGLFTRTNIVPYQNPPTNTVQSQFVKYPGRDDCASTFCTYSEEMTNFANWYAYYRSRMQMAKTAIGRAFNTISDNFRVGFMTINPDEPVSSSRFLASSDFDATQKGNWYTKLYGVNDNGSTPLREALSRVGHYYAGETNTFTGMGSSPIQVSCQPNYTILVTDGYWNGNDGVTKSGGNINDQDDVDAGYSTSSIGAYDALGVNDTLADVALYYYKTDLRTDLADNVPTTQKDTAAHQHMTTFTVGMGLAGLLNFSTNYEEQTSGDFVAIKQGVKAWPDPTSAEEAKLDDLWHAAVNGRGRFFSAKDPTELARSITDTLSAVQSRVGAGAAAATSNLQPVAGDNFAFTAQFQTVEWTGDLKARTIDLSSGIVATRELWSASSLLEARDPRTRRIFTFDSTDTTAGAGQNGNKLKSFCWPGAFATGNYSGCNDGRELDATELTAYFDPQTLSQVTQWNADVPQPGRNGTATSQNLIDFLRGERSNETTGGTAAGDLYRSRSGVLGDIVNAQPAYVKSAPFGYNLGTFAGSDPYYQEYKTSTATRKGTVFAASNDGMLHAFETDPDNDPYFQTAGIATAETTDDTFTGTLNTSAASGEGSERWAYVPSMVLSRLKLLAETNYAHQYFVDGSPTVGDVCFGHTTSTPCSAQSNWRTILVAGLNAGGRGFYALDITDPANPVALWEFKGGSGQPCIAADSDVTSSSGQTADCHVGLSFGNPLITKRPSDGKWVVIVTSGYNNVNPGDGKGHLYVLDAQTGVVLQRMSTPVGCDGVITTGGCTAGTVDPSGLARINAWVNNAFSDNKALTVYGGDLKGNLWRFELDGNTNVTVTAGSVTRIATLVDPSNVAQPITTKPELAEVNGKRVVYVATGKFLGTSDKTTIQRQSIYAIKDEMNSITSPTIAMTRSGSFPTSAITGFVRQDLSLISGQSDQRTTTTNAVSFANTTDHGWFVDLPDGGSGTNPSERVNVDPILQLGTLVIASNVPNSDTCVAGGFGWLNFLDYKTGSYIPGASGNLASTKIAASLVVGINVVQLPGGTVKTIATTADNQQLTKETPVAPSSIQGRRVSWRELFVE
jgi:type IV pilus assembly protein PilY1